MGMMGMFKWLRKDVIQRDRNGWNLAPKQCGFNNESYRNALQAFIDRRRFSDDVTLDTDTPSSPDKKRADLASKNNNNSKCDNEKKSQESKSIIPGVPHIRASEIFEIGWVAGTEDRYLELIFAEWQNTRVSLKRHTHPDCKDAVKADLDVLSEIRHTNVLLLMATIQTDDYGLVSIFESVDCTLYNYIHEQGERISIQGIAKCGGRLSDALRHSHMRGYIHSAISSHCVYLASNGIVKLGGWELAVHINNPKPEREYEERLRTEIFRWQAPELFYGYGPRKESDVYGLILLIWEMCTMRVPWSGYSRSDVERQYVHWKRGVIMDLYDFPPLLNNLLEAGLQLDVTKRTLDMNRTRRFLQRLEMQYEDEEPVYIDQYTNNNNNNEISKTYVLPKARSPTAATKNKRLTKCASAKQLSYYGEISDCAPKQYFYSKKDALKHTVNSKNSGRAEQINFFDVSDNIKQNAKDEIHKNTNVLCSVPNNHKKINSFNSNIEELDSAQIDESSNLQPWNCIYKKVRAPQETIESSATASIYSNSSPPLESTDDESYKDARTCLKQLKQVLANKREHFFYGSDSSHTSMCTSPQSKNTIFVQARNKEYEPHKPASHKTSLEPKYNKSPSQYDSSYMKSSLQQHRRIPYSHTPESVKEAIIQPQVLNSDSQSFFESSLWRKEKLICISKMRKIQEDDEPRFLFARHPDESDSTHTTCTLNRLEESHSTKSDNTYTINSTSKADHTGSSRELEEGIQSHFENTSDLSESLSPQSRPLQVLKDALDRATEIVRSVTPNTDESCPSPPFKTYENFEITMDDSQTRKSIFEDMYDLKANNDNEEIKSIERTVNGNDTFLLSTNSVNSTLSDKITKESDTDASTSVISYEKTSHTPHDATYTRNFVCESIAEVSNEHNASPNNIKLDRNTKNVYDAEYATEKVSKSLASIKCTTTTGTEQNGTETHTEVINTNEKKPVTANFTLMLLNDTVKQKNCKSCHESALTRRRSLPAALSQLRALNSSALGKLPIRRADVTDNTVEDLYIDDEFGDSLNVNMILLDEEISLDEDFLPDISEL